MNSLRNSYSGALPMFVVPLFGVLATFCLAGPLADLPAPSLFEKLPAEQTGITFKNRLEEGPGSNILQSEFYYNGGGVAVGDLNGDRLSDLYFTANSGNNALYLNKGGLKFEDITEAAGVSDDGGWTAGTLIADINGDGLQDIYVCKSGKQPEAERKNKLFINNGDLTFSEQATAYGLDDPGYCTQVALFDYDRDGDLDVYIVNYSVKTYTGFNIIDIRKEFDPMSGDKLYANEGEEFTDVTEEAGLLQNPIGFGLNVSVSDVNSDGWPDLFVTNDFMEKDYLYINRQDGTFGEEIASRTALTSYYSMGSDIADINNDGFTDILTVDMLPYNYTRRKIFKTPDYGMYEHLALHGYHRQNMRNTLQINRGDGTFTEAGRLAGIVATDWSWASMLADLDNDGHKDLFVTNGFPRFYTDLDYLNEVLWEEFPEEKLTDDQDLLYELVQMMDRVELQNFAFRNEGGLTFSDQSEAWGLDQWAVSNGAAFADLDNNGSLELIVNNINDTASVFKNNSAGREGANYLKVRLKGGRQNGYGIGAKVSVRAENGELYFQENFPTRGYQSSVGPVLHFGVGENERVDVEVVWPDQSKSVAEGVAVNRRLVLEQKDVDCSGSGGSSGSDGGSDVGGRSEGSGSDDGPDSMDRPFVPLDVSSLGFEDSHQGHRGGNTITSPLMPHTLKNLGPALARADVNLDGYEDLFVGGGRGQLSSIYLQQADGTFARNLMPAFGDHREMEDVDALFFDSNRNGYQDLYVVSGGNNVMSRGGQYQDRLYLNDGFGRFVHAPDALPRMETSGGVVMPLDLEGDGDLDLFIGGRVLPNRYPSAPRSYLLENRGGEFRDVTSGVAPELKRPGMVSDAVWTDVDSDGRGELVLAGEWMPLRVFSQQEPGGGFREVTEPAGLAQSAGWWNSLEAADLNGDGHVDLVAGNRGLNSSFTASAEHPLLAHMGDFNGDGMPEALLSKVVDGRRYPVERRDLLAEQFPRLEQAFPDYASFAAATMEDVLEALGGGGDIEELPVHTLASAVFKNNGDGAFRMVSMPDEAQVAPVYDMIVTDFDGDGVEDLLAGGNSFGIQPRFGPVAGEGVFLRGNRDFSFEAIGGVQTGFRAVNEVRGMEVVPSEVGPLIVLGNYDHPLEIFLFRGF